MPAHEFEADRRTAQSRAAQWLHGGHRRDDGSHTSLTPDASFRIDLDIYAWKPEGALLRRPAAGPAQVGIYRHVSVVPFRRIDRMGFGKPCIGLP